MVLVKVELLMQLIFCSLEKLHVLLVKEVKH